MNTAAATSASAAAASSSSATSTRVIGFVILTVALLGAVYVFLTTGLASTPSGPAGVSSTQLVPLGVALSLSIAVAGLFMWAVCLALAAILDSLAARHSLEE